jgi:hypothetical protein
MYIYIYVCNIFESVCDLKEFHFTNRLALMSDSSIFRTRIDMRRIDKRRIPVSFKDALSSPD